MHGSLRVLVVDDQATMRSMVKKMLHQMGSFSSIEDAGDGEEGWGKIKSQTFDLVITDVDMPRLDGIGLIKRCRSDMDLKSLPFLVISGHSVPAWVAWASEWGAYDYIVKPFSYSFLKERIDSLFERFQSPEESLFRDLEHLKKHGHADKVLTKLEEIEKGEPLKLKWLNLKGECLMEVGRFREAAAELEKVMELSDTFLPAHKNYAAVQRELGNLEKAILSLEKADKLSPMDLERKITLGTLLMENGRQDESHKVLTAALKEAPKEEKENYRLRIAEIYMANKNYALAEDLYVKNVKSNPACIEAFNRLGIALRQQGKLEEAEKYYQLALRNHPKNAAICYNLAILYMNRQKREEAQKLLQRVVELEPGFKKAEDLLRQLEEAPEGS